MMCLKIVLSVRNCVHREIRINNPNQHCADSAESEKSENYGLRASKA